MRTTTINNVTINYLDSTSWLYDNLFIELVGNGVTVGAQIKVTDIASGMYRKLKYISEMQRLVFPLNDTMKSLYHDAISFNIVVNVYEDGVQSGSFGFNVDILNGKSLPFRAHGSTRTIYAYSQDDLYKIQFLFPASGNFNVNGHGFPIAQAGLIGFDLRSYITHNGIYSMCYQADAESGPISMSIVNAFSDTPFSGVAQLSFADESGEVPENEMNKGDIWEDSRFSSDRYCIDLIYEEACNDFNLFHTRYLDTDGCIRFLGGKIISQTTNQTANNFYRLDTDSVYMNISRKHRQESSGTVKVAYESLRRDSYWSDILLSDIIWFENFDGEWFECSIVDKKVTVNSDDTQDVTLEFELFNM